MMRSIFDHASSVEAAAKAFISIGGRLMINPHGRFEAAIDAGKLLREGAEADNMTEIARRLYTVSRQRGAKIRLKKMIARNGRPVSAWLVLGGN